MKTIFPLRHLFAVAAITLITAAQTFALDPGVFELDGNAVTNHSGTGLPDDWDRINPGPNSHAAVSSFVVDPPNATIFTGGGSKDVLDISQWKFTSGSVPDKDEITDAYAAAYTDSTTGEVLLYFGADRYDTSGDSQIGFWFFQNPITLKTGRAGSGTFDGVHAIGDILILSDFTTGGGISTIRVFEWVGSGGSDGPLNLLASGVDCSTSSSGDVLCAEVNGSAQSSPWAYTPKTGTFKVFPAGAFFEGGANLNKLLPGTECFSTFLVETRSAQSVTATLKDFVLGSFNFAPSVSVGNRSICSGSSATMTATVTGGLGTPTFSWTGPNGFTATTQQITVSTAGTYTVTVTTSSNCKATASGVLTMNPTPSATITPASAEICAGSSQTFTLNISSGTAPYTIEWSGPNGFSSNATSITVSTAGTYSAVITDSKGCTTGASANLTVNPNPQVVIGGPTGCASVPATLTANITSGTAPFIIHWSGPGGFSSSSSSISVSTGGLYSVSVTDSKGCSASTSRALGLCLQ
jgi:hypothetical protein